MARRVPLLLLWSVHMSLEKEWEVGRRTGVQISKADTTGEGGGALVEKSHSAVSLRTAEGGSMRKLRRGRRGRIR